MALVGGLAIPTQRLSIVFANTAPLGVKAAQVVLRSRMALFGGLAEPFSRERIVPGDTLAVPVQLTEVGLRDGIALLGKFLPFLEGGREVTAIVGGQRRIEIGRADRG